MESKDGGVEQSPEYLKGYTQALYDAQAALSKHAIKQTPFEKQEPWLRAMHFINTLYPRAG